MPTTYGVTFIREGLAMDGEVLGLLPPAAQDLLRDRTWRENRNGTSAFWGTQSIPTDEVRALVDILDGAGVDQDPEWNAYALQYEFDDPSSSATIYFQISPSLPAVDY